MAKSTPSIPAAIKPKYDAIWALIEPFARERLNDEYLALSQRLLAVLARKRPSPLANGTSGAWAAAVVRAIGWVNFLDDPGQKPHMKLPEIDKAFGVSSGTGQTKSKTIRDLLKIYAFDPQWTLPSKLADNPRVWMIQINGFIVDARSLSREIQEEAFAQGVIPYIPAKSDDADEAQTN